MGTSLTGLATKSVSHKKRISIIVFLSIFFDLLGFGILIPIQPFFALSFGADPAVITLLGASYSFMQLIFVPLWGRISDRFGRKPVMIISITIATLGFIIFAFAKSLPQMFFSRMLAGLGGANIGCAQAIMADITEKEERAKAMATTAAAMGLGFMCGPFIGGMLGKNGFMLPALFSAGLALVNLLLALCFLPETKKPTNQAKKSLSLKMVVGDQNTRLLFFLSFAVIMAFSLFEQCLAMFIHEHFGHSAHDYVFSIERTSQFLVLVAIVSVIVQLTFLKRFAFLGEKKLFLWGSLISVIGLATLIFMTRLQSFFLFMIAGMVFAAGFSCCLPSLSSLISKSVSVDDQGAAFGASQGFSALGRVVGPAGCGLLFEWWSFLPLLLSAIVFFNCFLLCTRFKSR